MTHDKLEDICDEEWDRTLAVNLSAFFYLTKAALPHMRPGASIIGTSSVNSDSPTPASAALRRDEGGHRQHDRGAGSAPCARGIRANSVAPGPVWTPLIPSTMPAEHVRVSAPRPRSAARDSRPRSRRCT